MTNPTFTPQIIGEPDADRIKQVTNLYELICSEATSLKCNLEMMFAEDEAKISNEFLLDLLNSDPEKFIRTNWFIHKKIDIPGINREKFIASDLFDIPKYDEIIEGIGYIKELLAEAKSLKINYPLGNLTNDDGYFSLNEAFHNQLQESGTVYTESLQQNEVLQAVTELKNAINKLCNLRIVPVNNLANIGLRLDRHVLKRTNQKDTPFELNPRMFHTTLRHLPKV